jgi:polysaccharide biosynthesis transport protein
VSRSTQDGSDESGRGRAGTGETGRSDELNLPHLLRILRRRGRVVIASVITVFLLGMLYCIVSTRRYEAVADLAINPEGSDALDMGDLTARLGGGGLGFDEKLETQVHILKSDSLAWTVISELRLDKEPAFAGHRGFLSFRPPVIPGEPGPIEQTSPERRNGLLGTFGASLTVQTIARTQAVEITFRNASPTLAREIVNHLVSAYTERTFVTRYNNTLKASTWLSEQLEQLKSGVQESQEKLSTLQKKTGIFGTDENDNLVLSKLDDLSKELTDAEADRIVKEAQYRIAQSGDPELISTIAPDSVLSMLRGQEADFKNQLALANAEYGPQYPRVIQLRDELAQTEKSLQKDMLDIRQRFRLQYQLSADTEHQLQGTFDQQKQRAYEMSAGLDQYGILKREVESGNDLYEDLVKKLKEAAVVAGLKAATVDVIDPARLPTSPVEPKTSLVLALSIIFGLGLGVGLAFTAESLDNLIRSPDEIETLTGLPFFGLIPHIKPDKEKNGPGTSRPEVLMTFLRPNSRAAEAFRALRTALLLASAGKPPKVIMIASAVPNEGKTTISMNVAAVLGLAGARVLLVDADLRRGMIAERLHITGNLGLSGSITGSVSWRDAVEPVAGAANLFALPAGLRPPNSAELLGSAEMHALIEEWRAEYDHVIIDSAPCLVVTDAVLVAQKADAVILVSRIAVTQRKSLQRAAELLQFGAGHVTGIVANDVGISESNYGYGYGYGYGKYNDYYSEERQ